jgi:hypothetical protein
MGGTGATAGVWTPKSYWFSNRLADLMDVFAIGAGITTENRIGGPIPPSLGAYAEFTTLLNLGIITHNGATAEMEGRGAGAFTEARTLYGIGPYRAWKINQGEQCVNYYKNSVRSQAWAKRMETDLRSSALARVNRWASNTEAAMLLDITEVGGDPAKRTLHKDRLFHRALFGVPRGWQTWEYVGAEVAVCEPFLTHLGVTLRAGFDLSEVADFVLGVFCIDFKQDDRRLGE